MFQYSSRILFLMTLWMSWSTGYLVHAIEKSEDITPGAYMAADKFASWWKFGDQVKFVIAGKPLPTGVTAIKGVVTDGWESEIATITVSAADIGKGWTWMPKEPGYYEVEFMTVNQDGSTTSMARAYRMKAKDAVRDFVLKKQGFAVVDNKPFPKQSDHQFGVCTYNSWKADMQLSSLIGFDLVRITAHWGPDGCGMVPDEVIEGTKGTYNWVGLDRMVKLYSENGFKLYCQVIGTPYWASPHPEEKGIIDICIDKATAYAPVDMSDWERFLDALVARYKDRITDWEIWNEPAMPGGSCYWSDTPENYAKLIKSAYSTIKKQQPESTVYNGGVGNNFFYHAFYKKLLLMDVDKYFDVFSIHGAWPEPFRNIDKYSKKRSKPAINTEWHAILQGNMQSSPILTDTNLSLRMMKELLFQFKQGLTKTMMFEIRNLTDKEAIPFCIENKIFTHSAGFFRRVPQAEPRLPSVIMAQFLSATGRKAKFIKEFQITNDSTAIILETAYGNTLVFWTEKEALNTKDIKEFSTAQSVLTDWEGKSIGLSENKPLKIKRVYYLSAPAMDRVDKMANVDKLISPKIIEKIKSKTKTTGQFVNGSLFDSVEKPSQIAENIWLKNDWRTKELKKDQQASNISAKAAFGSNSKGLDIVVEVKDGVHFQNESSAWWNGDSVQIAVDCENAGIPGGNAEFVFALTKNETVAWKILAADVYGNIPTQWSPNNAIAKYVQTNISRNGDITRYQIRIPWTELYPLIYDSQAEKELRVAIVVNNNNGEGRAEYLAWASGIGEEKDPSVYGLLKPIGESEPPTSNSANPTKK
ncbi:MAG: hypothetical protein B9S32_04220 [Verrucomicrobia bacterium Tous-C9LFEB]|nr:MAG: hypothetical protein B9S32_04220 [Verrucomicrobia bacterium Tous-C9LFEB]